MKILELLPVGYMTRIITQEDWLKYNIFLEMQHSSDCHMAQKPPGDVIVTSRLSRETADVMGHDETFTCWEHTFLDASLVSQLF
jgi:hypothetical protein